MRRHTLFLTSDPSDGTAGGDTSADGTHTTPPAAAAPTGSAPPAATAVVESDARPADAGELVETRRKLAEEQRARKDVEMRAAQLEDQVRTLSTPPPAPTKREKSKWLLMESDED